MFAVDGFMLVAGVLLLLGIASSKFSARMGVPVLVLFLGVGMLAGSEGIGGIDFEDYTTAHAIGTVALALILFDGGLRTPLSSVRLAWKPALSLATVGVLLTSVLTGIATAWILEIPLLHGVLLGSIIGSTDAAAVFAVLRSGGVSLDHRLAATLEIESGSNDPMAIFLTVGLLNVLLGRMEMGPDLAWLLLLQFSVGGVVGIGVGRGAAWLVDRVHLDAAGLYPILISASGLLAFGLAASLGGSGFLAVYLAGIVLGNSSVVFKRGILFFHDAAAWLAQIALFVMLGLLSFPSRLIDAAGAGILISAVLILLARPLSVALVLIGFRFTLKELVFLSWVGLKGAVPITLATFPFLFGLPGAELLFNVVFFVVLVSAITQGWTLPYLAQKLGLTLPARAQPPIALEITSLRHVNGDIVEYAIHADARAAGRQIRDLPLPEDVVVALIARGTEIIPPRGHTRLLPDDHVFLVLRHEMVSLAARIFGEPREPGEPAVPAGRCILNGRTTAGELRVFFDIETGADAAMTLADLILSRAGGRPIEPGVSVDAGEVSLGVAEVSGGRAELVAVTAREPDAPELSETAPVPDVQSL